MVGRLLAQMGVGHIALYDADTIEAVNLAPQGWPERMIGQPKVAVLAEELKALNSEIQIELWECFFPPHHLERYNARFCCVDKISTRETIFKAMPHDGGLWVDGRSAGECLEVYATNCGDKGSRDAYEKTLFSQEEAYQAGCTTVSLNYTAAIAAGLEVGQFARWLRGFPIQHIKYNILSGEMETTNR